MADLAYNKRARFDYDILDVLEGGLVLTGAEVKSAKAGHLQLQGSFVQIRGGEAWLKNTFIAPFKSAGIPPKDKAENPNRKILLHHREITRLLSKQKADGLTIVPIRAYIKRNLVKIEIGLARGKKKYEKRESIKKRDVERQLRERMKEGR